MKDFPSVVRNKKNAIDEGSQSSGVSGYVFDGADGSQAVFWTCEKDGDSKEHVHPYDEYFLVVSGQYDLIIKDETVPVLTGEECLIPKGVPHAGRFYDGTRTIHVFGGKRAERKKR